MLKTSVHEASDSCAPPVTPNRLENERKVLPANKTKAENASSPRSIPIAEAFVKRPLSQYLASRPTFCHDWIKLTKK
jgi:hypothetical protein